MPSAGCSSSGEFASLLSQAPHLQRSDVQLRVTGVIVVIEDQLRHSLIGQVSGKNDHLTHGLVQGWQAPSVGVGTLQLRNVCQPVTELQGAHTYEIGRAHV